MAEDSDDGKDFSRLKEEYRKGESTESLGNHSGQKDNPEDTAWQKATQNNEVEGFTEGL